MPRNGKGETLRQKQPRGHRICTFSMESFLFNGLHPQSSIKNLFKRLKSSTLYPSLSLRQAQEGASEQRQIRHFRCSSHVKNRSNSSFTSGFQQVLFSKKHWKKSCCSWIFCSETPVTALNPKHPYLRWHPQHVPALFATCARWASAPRQMPGS